MLKVGAQTYPDTIPTILDDDVFVKVFFQHLKAESAMENLLFLLTGFNPRLIYSSFIAPGSPQEINLSYAQRSPMVELAAAEDWDNAAWVDHLDVATAEILRLVGSDNLPRFWKSDAFWAHHEKLGGRRDEPSQKLPDPPRPPARTRAAKALGFKNDPLLQAYITAFESKGETLTLAACGKLLKAEGKSLKPHVFNTLLIKKGFARKPADFGNESGIDANPDAFDAPAPLDPETGETQPRDVAGLQVEFDLKKLRGCGYSLIKGAHLERLSAMVLSYAAGEQSEALKKYVAVQKAEKASKNLAIEGITFVEMMKKMRVEKAFSIGGAVSAA